MLKKNQKPRKQPQSRVAKKRTKEADDLFANLDAMPSEAVVVTATPAQSPITAADVCNYEWYRRQAHYYETRRQQMRTCLIDRAKAGASFDVAALLHLFS